MRPPTDMSASVKARLLNLRLTTGRPFYHLLSAYVLERILYRLSESEHRDRFVLKGAVLLSVWFDTPHRATCDLDLMGYGSNSSDSLVQTFRDICGTPVELDGLVFASDTIAAETIRNATEHVGVRVTCVAFLGSARCPVQVDVGFGDAITPSSEFIELATLLDAVLGPLGLEALLGALRLRAGDGHEVLARPPGSDDLIGDALVREPEVPLGLVERRVDDRVLDRYVAHRGLPCAALQARDRGRASGARSTIPSAPRRRQGH